MVMSYREVYYEGRWVEVWESHVRLGNVSIPPKYGKNRDFKRDKRNIAVVIGYGEVHREGRWAKKSS